MERYSSEYIAKRLQFMTYEELSQELSADNQGARGFSVAAVKRYCSQSGIHKRQKTAGITDDQLDALVSTAIDNVGGTYGKRMMKGYLDSQMGCCAAGESRVRKSLDRVSSQEDKLTRMAGAAGRLQNPHVYKADYFGEKWHIDQNEKLVRYGVTVVCMIDGYSRKIVGSAVMQIKNNVIIYDRVYRSAILTYGLATQLRSDHGAEFVLCQDVQNHLAHLRLSQHKIPVARTTSTKNLPIERLWVEVNLRVQYPIKKAVVYLEDRGDIDMSNSSQKEIVSICCQGLAQLGLSRVVDSWNAHTIRGRGKPNSLAADQTQIYKPRAEEIPSIEEAIASYPGRLTMPKQLSKAKEEWLAAVDMSQFYGDIVNKKYDSLLDLLLLCPAY